MRRIVFRLGAIILVLLPFLLLTESSLLKAATASEETRSLTLDEAVRTGSKKAASLKLPDSIAIWQGRKSGRAGQP